MQFRTELLLPQSADKIRLGHRFLTVGSCFAEVIGSRLSEHKLDTLNNPFGTIFNPISQFELVQAALAPEEQEELPLVQQNGRWYAYNFHSSFTAPSRHELQEQIDFALTLVREQIEKAQTIVFTFGTALVYQLSDSDRIVANCHKMPQSNFNKRLLQSEEIVAAFTEMFALIKSVNPAVRVILTVSPVRHLKETLVLNSVSKSVLRVACHYLAEMLPDVDYFPAFELLMDDLRDYRFYKDDLLHPTEMAEQYVWQKFGEVYFDEKLQKFADEWSRIRQSLAHKPFQPDSEGHQQFLQGLLKQLEQLGKLVNVTAELEQVKQQLMPVRRNKAPKKATLELVNLLETLAASEVMAEDEDGYRSSPAGRNEPEREVTLSEAFAWPDEEEERQFEAPEPQPEKQKPETAAAPEIAAKAEPAQPSPAEETAPAPVADEVRTSSATEPFVHTKKSKSKKRREKRRAKLLASRGLTASGAPVEEKTPEAATGQPSAVSPEEITLVNQLESAPAGRPVKKARNQRNKLAGKQPATGTSTEFAAATPEPVTETTPVAAPDTPETTVLSNAPAISEVPEKAPLPARKKPGRKPAAAVGALLNALAQQAQATPAKPARAPRTPRKPVALPPVSPEPPLAEMAPAPEVGPTPVAVAAPTKPKRTPARKAKPATPELPFTPVNASEMASALPPPEIPEPVAVQTGPASDSPLPKPAKEPKPKKEPATPKKGKAKKIVLQKSPSGKGGNS